MASDLPSSVSARLASKSRKRSHMHIKHGVIHRDIKPANILLTSQEKYGVERPKITDFGVAKLGAAQLTSTGQILGSPAFMPPEQFTGAPIDGRSDLFSLGVILYWMATGEYAFPGETITAVSYKVVNTEPVPPRKLNPAVPSGFDQIILKCLAKAPSDRYATGEDLARDLAALRAGRTTAELQAPVPISGAANSSSAMDVTLDSHPEAPPSTAGTQQSGAGLIDSDSSAAKKADSLDRNDRRFDFRCSTSCRWLVRLCKPRAYRGNIRSQLGAGTCDRHRLPPNRRPKPTKP